MSCLVKLFEPNSASPPVHVDLTAASIEIVAVNQATLANCCNLVTNAPLKSGSHYGADLQFTKTSIVYQVAVSDPNGRYGGTTILSLSGTTDGDLDVVLEKLPRGGASGARQASNAAQARYAVLGEPSWTPGEKQAVLGLMLALTSLRGTTEPKLLSLIRDYSFILRDLGINPDLF